MTEDTIFYQSVFNALTCGASLGLVGGLLGVAGMGSTAAGVVSGTLSAIAGGYIGYNYNEYSDIEPNTWVHWNVVVVYY